MKEILNEKLMMADNVSSNINKIQHNFTSNITNVIKNQVKIK